MVKTGPYTAARGRGAKAVCVRDQDPARRAKFREAGRSTEHLDLAELWGMLGLEPLLSAGPLTRKSGLVHWCAAHDPWLGLLEERLGHAAPDLQDYPKQCSGRFALGRRVEALAKWLLNSVLDAELIAYNYPVRDTSSNLPNQTIGELDLVYRLPGSAVIRHRELAAKWYLYDPDNATPLDAATDLRWASGWWGPQRRDRLDLKLAKMRDHQITLGQHSATRASLGADSPQLHELWINGQLFWPAKLRLPRPHAGETPQLNETAICGYWLRYGAWCRTRWLHEPNTQWVQLRKQEWLRARHPQDASAILDPEPGRQWEAPQLLALQSKDDQGPVWRERMRVFIVPDSWGA